MTTARQPPPQSTPAPQTPAGGGEPRCGRQQHQSGNGQSVSNRMVGAHMQPGSKASAPATALPTATALNHSRCTAACGPPHMQPGSKPSASATALPCPQRIATALNHSRCAAGSRDATRLKSLCFSPCLALSIVSVPTTHTIQQAANTHNPHPGSRASAARLPPSPQLMYQLLTLYSTLPLTAGFLVFPEARGAKVVAVWRVNLLSCLSRSTVPSVRELQVVGIEGQ